MDRVKVVVTRDQSLSTCNADDKVLEMPLVTCELVEWEPQGGALTGFCRWGVPIMIASPQGCPQYIDFACSSEYSDERKWPYVRDKGLTRDD